jgi:hypothetical protein
MSTRKKDATSSQKILSIKNMNLRLSIHNRHKTYFLEKQRNFLKSDLAQEMLKSQVKTCKLVPHNLPITTSKF